MKTTTRRAPVQSTKPARSKRESRKKRVEEIATPTLQPAVAVAPPDNSVSGDFLIFVSLEGSLFELEIPGFDFRIGYPSLFAAARHARVRSRGRNSTLVIYDESTGLVNRIPLAPPTVPFQTHHAIRQEDKITRLSDSTAEAEDAA